MNLPKMQTIALAGALALAWTATPASVRAHGDEDDGAGSRQEGPREDHGRRDGDRRGGERHEKDPEMREKFEKMRGLEHKAHEAARKLRKGSDADRLAAKTETKKLLGDLFVGVEEFLAELLETFGLFKGIQILSLQVLDEAYFEDSPVVNVDLNARDLREAGLDRGPVAPFPSDDLVSSGCMSDDQWLQKPVNLD